MGKRATTRRPAATGASVARRPTDGGPVPVVGAREPCPCGSGRRYKACHGRASGEAIDPFVSRPFQGLPGECDWVAMREIVPAATATVWLVGEHASTTVTVATVLPMAWPAVVRQDGEILIGLQVAAGSGDPSRNAADALLQALEAEPGTPVTALARRSGGPRLQDLVDPARAFDVTVHDGFDFWLDGTDEPPADVTASMERANEAVVPTVRLKAVEAAYWCEIRDRNHLRWVLPHDEERALDAIARLHAAGADRVGEGTRYVGSFRAGGLLVPVWDLPSGMPAEALEEPVAALAERLGNALADARPLDDAERRARAGLRNRQVTLR